MVAPRRPGGVWVGMGVDLREAVRELAGAGGTATGGGDGEGAGRRGATVPYRGEV